jgi:CpeT/CpcT family (DUF1001)
MGWAVMALLSGAVLMLSACSSQADLRKAELAVLANQLPGNYRNQSQDLTILRLAAPMVGDQIFYVRETMADDSRRVISERIWSLDVAAGKRILAAVYALDDADRWRGGADSPELFRSLLTRDLRSLPGCELEWQTGPSGFSAHSASASCPQSWRLEGDELSFSNLANAAASVGAAIPPGGHDPYFHFLRSAGSQQ